MDAFKQWPPSLPVKEQTDLLTRAMDYLPFHGALMRPAVGQITTRPADATGNALLDMSDTAFVMHAPFALFPSPFPRDAFNLSLQLQPLFNRLVHAVSQDQAFLHRVFAPIAPVDPFTGALYRLWSEMRPSHQSVVLGLHRSDYMLHMDPEDHQMKPLQVELNTIASSMAQLATQTSAMHSYLADLTSFYNASDPHTLDIDPACLPPNRALQGLVDGLAAACKAYTPSSNTKESQIVVLMVVQPKERNAFDQRALEYDLYRRHQVTMMRRTLAEVAKEARYAEVDDRRRLMLGDKEVAVAYYRAGYGPGDYPTDAEWQARRLIEESYAIKCPTVAYQLVGAKKVQQVLAEPDMLEQYLPSSDAATLRRCFAGIYPLDASKAGLEAYRLALSTPDLFVMKPQREGGGNNFYGEDIPKQLATLSVEERGAYILMERIRPPPYKNILVRQGVAVETDVICELGVYGAYLHDGETERMNSTAGTLLRTKSTTTNEGGVATGYSVIDSPFLI